MHLVNYNMSKLGFKVLTILNVRWKILSSIKVCTYYTLLYKFRFL
jgi:hypothetical protein